MPMKISILIPIYNVVQYVQECLDSIDASLSAYDGEVDHEIIIVNDASTDGSDKICTDYVGTHPKARMISHDVNKGLAEARNTLLANAKGDYVAWVDSDDVVKRDWFARIANAVEKYEPDVFAFELETFPARNDVIMRCGEKGLGLKRGEERFVDGRKYALQILHAIKMFDHSPARVVRRKLHDGLSYRAPRGIYEDTIFAYDFLPRVRTVYYYADSLYRYRYRADSLMHVRKLEDWIKAVAFQLDCLKTMTEPYRSAANCRVLAGMRQIMIAAAKNPQDRRLAELVAEYRKHFRKGVVKEVLCDGLIPFRRKLIDIGCCFKAFDRILKKR